MKPLIKKILIKYWAKKNPVKFAKLLGVKVGKGTRLLSVNRSTFGSEPYLISLGEHVTITSGVRFITHDGGIWIFRNQHPNIDIIKPIKVGDNTFIGLNTIILPGIKIGNNCIVGAGSIVTKNIPDNSVYAGVPAKYICNIDDYYKKNKNDFLDTKLLDANEKKKYLIDMYQITESN
jgi:acetyltransferase-like isoleucine patch superfamily enzyme